ncbi:uncharacterized protein LOC130897410 [Diorhabda carinulata]|uniref:uncharacterized protein LOC130897410 n=1 Tax=Diorhabda carinulata TaxID=1163345 RepID=UPI0025A22328|nr:uncharacterized protein LOC130897410 [Diorhabda carinulata]
MQVLDLILQDIIISVAVKFFTKLMDDEKLIELVRKYPVIYDTGHAKYLDTKHKLQIWNKIGEEIQKNRQASSVTLPPCNGILSNAEFIVEDVGSVVVKENPSYLSIKLFKLHATQPTRDNNSDTISHTETEDQLSPVIKRPSVPTKRKLPEQDPASTTLMKYLLARGDNQKTENVHPLDAFFSGLAATVKIFSPYYQHLAKSRLFNVVQQLEEEQLQHPTVEINSNNRTPMTTPSPTGALFSSTHTNQFPLCQTSQLQLW